MLVQKAGTYTGAERKPVWRQKWLAKGANCYYTLALALVAHASRTGPAVPKPLPLSKS